jgi:hypothetical protein
MRWNSAAAVMVGVLAASQGAAGKPPVGGAPGGAPSAAAERVDLRPDFTGEQESTYDQSLRIVQKRLMQGEQALEAILRRRLVVRTVGSSKDGAKVELSMAQVALKITPPVAKVFLFDSVKAPIENPRTPLADSLHALARLTLTFDVTPEGRARLTGGREALEEALAKDPKRDMAAYFSEEAMSQLVTDIFSVAPAGVGTVGETWSTEELTELGGTPNVRVHIDYRLMGVKDGVARIEGKGKLELPEQPPVVEGLATTIKSQLNQFEVLWDTRLGRVRSSRSEQTLTLDQGGGAIELGMQLSTLGDLRWVDPKAAEGKQPPIVLPPETTTEPAPEGIPRKPGT